MAGWELLPDTLQGALMREPTLSPPTVTEEREAGINCEGDDGERAEEQVITARLLLERRGQSVERHATCTIPMIPQEGEQIAGGGMKGTGGRGRGGIENIKRKQAASFLLETNKCCE